MEINLDEKYFQLIKSGQKIVEGRCATDRYTALKSGDSVFFVTKITKEDSEGEVLKMLAEIIGTKKYASFEDMLVKEGIENCLPGITDIGEGVRIYRGFPGYEDNEKILGVIAIHFKLID